MLLVVGEFDGLAVQAVHASYIKIWHRGTMLVVLKRGCHSVKGVTRITAAARTPDP